MQFCLFSFIYSCYYDIDTTSFIKEMGYYDHGSLEKVSIQTTHQGYAQ